MGSYNPEIGFTTKFVKNSGCKIGERINSSRFETGPGPQSYFDTNGMMHPHMLEKLQGLNPETVKYLEAKRPRDFNEYSLKSLLRP